MIPILIDNQEIDYTFRRSARAKRLRMQIDSEKKLTVVVPERASDRQIRLFIDSNQAWIEKQFQKAASLQAKRPKLTYSHGDTLFYLGDPLTLQITHATSRSLKISDTHVHITLNTELPKVQQQKIARELIVDFYKKKAAEVIHDRLQNYNEHYEFHYNKVTFRNQKTRWGSCSSAKNLNFNWRLFMAPIEVIDYVVVHELCHLKHMNHSPKFWAEVAKKVPTHKKWRKWLKDYSYLLQL